MEEEILRRGNNLLEKISLEGKRSELSDLEKMTYNSDFWKDTSNSTKVLKKIADLKREIDDIEMLQLLLEEKDFVEAEKLIKKYESLIFLSGEFDKNDTIFAIHSGQGGTEAMDWANMLYRMYTRYLERKNWKLP